MIYTYTHLQFCRARVNVDGTVIESDLTLKSPRPIRIEEIETSIPQDIWNDVCRPMLNDGFMLTHYLPAEMVEQ